MPTGSTLPVSWCRRSFTKVSVSAMTRDDRAVQPHRGVDVVGEQVAGDARARGVHVEAPERRPALGHVRRDGPVLEELGAVVVRPADPALVDQLPGERDRRHAPVVVPDHVGHARALDRGDHRLAFGRVHGERLLARDPSCRLRRRRARSPGAGDWARRCRSGRCRRARSGASSRSRRSRSPRHRRTPRPCRRCAPRPPCSTGRCSSAGKKSATRRQALECALAMKP